MGSGASQHDTTERGDLEKAIASKQTEVDTVDANGRTMLLNAVVAGDVGAVQFLLENGAGNVRDRDGRAPLWHALQHRDTTLREALEAALQPHALLILDEVEAIIRAYLDTSTDTQSLAAHSVAESSVSNVPLALTPHDESADLRRTDGRKVEWLKETQTTSDLLVWLRGLPKVEPPLGYTEEHIVHMEAGFALVCERLLEDIATKRENGRVDDWMAACEPFQLLLAGFLFTSDCVEYVIHGGRVVCDNGVPQIATGPDGKPRYIQLTDRDTLDHHGSPESVTSQSLALYSTMNRAMRAVGWLPCIKEWSKQEVPNVFALSPAPPQLHVISTFQPLICGLRRLIASRRKHLRTVFRGIDVNVSAKYAVGTHVVWNCFTSTTLKREVATSFMYGKGGTFFVIVAKGGAADVKFSSVFSAEDELLYTANIEYRVQWKLSPTLLRMMGLRFDVIVMQEVGSGDVTAAEQVHALQEVMGHTVAFFSDYLSQYVEGRVGDDTRVAEKDTRPLMREVQSWLDSNTNTPHTPDTPHTRRTLCVVGDGGSGKTSASIAILSELATTSSTSTPTPTSKPYFPVFVALPSVKPRLLETGGLGRFVLDSFGMSEADRTYLTEAYNVVVVLDSLDEVGFSQAEVDAIVAEGGLAARHPWLQMHCSVVVTVRDEYLKSVSAVPSAICGPSVKAVYMQPFTEIDARNYITRASLAWERTKKNDEIRTEFVREEDIEGLVELRNPFVLHMACHAQCAGDATEEFIYEMYLQKWTAAEMVGQDVSVEAVLRAGELVACRMLETNEWQGTVGIASKRLAEHAVAEEVCEVCFRCLPFRIEDFGERSSAFTFRHKSLGEHLAARRLAREPADTFSIVQRCFSKDSQRVLAFFASIVQQDGASSILRVKTELLEAVRRTIGDEGEDVLTAGSNAAALLARTRITLREEKLDGVRLQHADMRGMLFSGTSLEGATFAHCWLEHTEFHTCHVENAAFTSCSLGTPLPPLRHAKSATGVALTPDNRHIATSSTDKSVRVWDITTGKETWTFKGHSEGVLGVHITYDGAKVVSYSRDKTVRIWDMSTGEMLHTLQHSDAVTGVVLSPDGVFIVACSGSTLRGWKCASGAAVWSASHDKASFIAMSTTGQHIVSGSKDKTLRVWMLANGKAVQTLKGHSGAVTHAVFTEDGHIVSCSQDKSIRVWDTTSGELLRTIKTPQAAQKLAVSSGQVLACFESGVIGVWALLTGERTLSLEGHSLGVLDVSVRDGYAVSCSHDQTVRVWNLATGRERFVMEGHTDAVAGVVVSPNGRQLVSRSWDTTVRIWDMPMGKEATLEKGHSQIIYGVDVNAAATHAVTGSADTTVRVWELATGRETHVFEGHTRQVNCVAFAPDGTHVASGSDDITIRWWNLSKKKQVLSLKGHSVGVAGVITDGTQIISWAADNVIRVWDIEGECSRLKLESFAKVVGLAVSADRLSLTACNAANTLLVWDLEKGKVKKKVTLTANSKCVSAAVTPDGSQVVTASDDKLIRVWDVSTGKQRLTFKGHSRLVTSVALTPDATRIVSCSLDNTVRVWDKATEETLHTLHGHSDAVLDIAVTKDALRIVSVSRDKTLRVWGLPPAPIPTAATEDSSSSDDDKQKCYLEARLGVTSTVPRAFNCIDGETVTPDVARRIVFG